MSLHYSTSYVVENFFHETSEPSICRTFNTAIEAIDYCKTIEGATVYKKTEEEIFTNKIPRESKENISHIKLIGG